MREKIGVRCPHLSFCFSCMLLNIIAPSQHPRHWNDFRSQLMNLIIHHRNRLFFVCQVFIHFHTSEATTRAKSLKYTSSASRHGTLDVLVTYPEVKPIANRYATMPILSSISKGPMYLGANFPFLPNVIVDGGV